MLRVSLRIISTSIRQSWLVDFYTHLIPPIFYNDMEITVSADFYSSVSAAALLCLLH